MSWVDGLFFWFSKSFDILLRSELCMCSPEVSPGLHTQLCGICFPQATASLKSIQYFLFLGLLFSLFQSERYSFSTSSTVPFCDFICIWDQAAEGQRRKTLIGVHHTLLGPQFHWSERKSPSLRILVPQDPCWQSSYHRMAWSKGYEKTEKRRE